MGSAAGRLALGVVGALVAPVGFAALGFAIGSAVGSLIFPAEGPTVEGPRISDTSVSTSSLGKTIEWHVGTVRTGGNIIWSAGLREQKKKEKVRSGGKGGGGGSSSTQITYHYFASFAISFGYAPGMTVKRIWGDGKLIFDSSRAQGKHRDLKFRFVRGGEDTPVDPLISESINRRLAKMADVNRGNQKQKEYKDMSVLIQELVDDGSARAAIYADRLSDIDAAAKSAAGGGVPDYDFTPSYKDLCYIVFDNLPLADFANRIPNITIEAEFEVEAPQGVEYVANLFDVTTISSGVPTGGLGGLDVDNQFLITDTANALRKFDSYSTAETARVVPTEEILRVLAINKNREALCVGTKGGQPALHLVNTASMTILDSLTRPASWSFLTGYDPETDRVMATRFPRRTYDEKKPENSVADSFLVFTHDRVSLMSSATQQNLYYETSFGQNNHESGDGSFFNGGNGGWYGDTMVQPSDVDFVLDTIHLNAGTLVQKTGAFSVPYRIGDSPTLVMSRFGDKHVQLVRIQLARVTRQTDVPETFGQTETGYGDTFSDGYWFMRRDENGGMYYVDGDGVAYMGTPNNTRTYTLDGLTFGFVGTYDFSAELGGLTIEDVCFLNYDYIEELNADSEKDVPGFSLFDPSWLLPIFGVDGSDSSGGDFGPGRETNATTNHQFLLRLSDGTGRVFNSQTGKLTPVPLPPKADSGFASSVAPNGVITYASGNDLVDVFLRGGTYNSYANAFPNGASADNQVYLTNLRALMTWHGTEPVLAASGSPNASLGGSRSLGAVLESLCIKSGMASDEFDITGLGGIDIRGMTVARKSSFRQVIEILLDAKACDGMESDWKIVFLPKHSTIARRVHEDRLRSVGDDDNPSNFIEVRSPEYDLPREIQLTFVDPDRDYETNTVQTRRPSAPISTMDSVRVENLEVPLVMMTHEAQALTDKAMFKKWMQRDTAQWAMAWDQLDLDPTDVIEVEFRDGTVLTERVERAMVGANFEIEFDGVRNDDPVFEERELPRVNSAALPRTVILTPVPSDTFVFDIPAIEDFHATVGVPSVYAAVGAQSDQWVSAALFRSFDSQGYEAVDSFSTDIVWGVIDNVLEAPRAYWITDTVNTLTVFPLNDEGEIVSVTREELLDGANKAIIWNPVRNEGEIIAFQDAEVQPDGSVVLSNLLRGLRGTEYFCDQHESNEQFFLIDDTRMSQIPLDIGRLNSLTYWKAVSTGQIIGEVTAHSIRPRGRDLAPWAPSRARRSSDGSGGITLTWNRRARIGGQWNTSASVEAAPIIEPEIGYNIWVLGPNQYFQNFDPDRTTTFLAALQSETQTVTLTAADLTEWGITEDDMIRVVIQQVGNYAEGFYGRYILAP